MLVKLLLLGVCLSVALILCGEVRHPTLRTFFLTIVGFALASLCYIQIWLSMVAVAIILLLAVSRKSLRGALPLVPAMALSVLLIAQPGAEDMLWLETKYADTFLYIEDGLYYSEMFQENIKANRYRGDTYQSLLYNNSIKTWVLGSLNHQIEVVTLRVETVQTNYLARNMKDYAEKVRPEVFLYIKVPRDVNFNRNALKYVTKLEVI